jgi:hypothetical protein
MISTKVQSTACILFALPLRPRLWIKFCFGKGQVAGVKLESLIHLVSGIA